MKINHEAPEVRWVREGWEAMDTDAHPEIIIRVTDEKQMSHAIGYSKAMRMEALPEPTFEVPLAVFKKLVDRLAPGELFMAVGYELEMSWGKTRIAAPGRIG